MTKSEAVNTSSVSKEIWEMEGITWFNKLILHEINFLDAGGGCSKSNDYFAKRFKTTSQSMKVMLSKLKAKGHIISLAIPKGSPHERLLIVNPALMTGGGK